MSRKGEPVRCGGQLRVGVPPVEATRVKLSVGVPPVIATGVAKPQRRSLKTFSRYNCNRIKRGKAGELGYGYGTGELDLQ